SDPDRHPRAPAPPAAARAPAAAMRTIEQVEKLLGALPAATLPVALLPVQVQTRYVTRAGNPQLLVRVYPDELHLDAHEPRLTAAEVAWGKKAWQLAWPANRSEEHT